MKTTTADAIESLGGTNAVAEALGVVPSAVRNWRRLNAFPPKHYLRLAAYAEAEGVALETALFREVPDQARVG